MDLQDFKAKAADCLRLFSTLDEEPTELTSEAIHSRKSAVKQCLIEAVSKIQGGNASEAVNMLKTLGRSVSSVAHPEFYSRELSDIYNNIACAYKSTGQVHAARKYLEVVKQYLPFLPSEDKASLHLNFCAVYSSLGSHDLAHSHGRKAMLLAQEAILQMEEEADTSHLVSILAAAYHNLGVEEEFRKNPGTAQELYQKAVQVLGQSSESSHLMDNCKKSLAGLRSNFRVRPVTVRSHRSLRSTTGFTDRPTTVYSERPPTTVPYRRLHFSKARREVASARPARPNWHIAASHQETKGTSSHPRLVRITPRPLRPGSTVSAIETMEKPIKLVQTTKPPAPKAVSPTETAAALLIQRQARVWLNNRRGQDEVKQTQSLSQAATKVQSAYKGWLVRQAFSQFSRPDFGFEVVKLGRTTLGGRSYVYKISRSKSDTKAALLDTDLHSVTECLFSNKLTEALPVESIVLALSLRGGRLHLNLSQLEEGQEVKSAVLRIERAYLKRKLKPPAASRPVTSKNLLSKSQESSKTFQAASVMGPSDLTQHRDCLKELQRLMRGVLARKHFAFLQPSQSDELLYKGTYDLDNKQLSVEVRQSPESSSHSEQKSQKLKIEIEHSYHRYLIFLDTELIAHLDGTASQIIQRHVLPCLRYDAESDCYSLDQHLLRQPSKLTAESLRQAHQHPLEGSKYTFPPRYEKGHLEEGEGKRQRESLQGPKRSANKSSSPFKPSMPQSSSRRSLVSSRPLTASKSKKPQKETHFLPVAETQSLYSLTNSTAGPQTDVLYHDVVRISGKDLDICVKSAPGGISILGRDVRRGREYTLPLPIPTHKLMAEGALRLVLGRLSVIEVLGEESLVIS
jgi:tetratricopeptide (TPR) repeat protein